MVSMTISLASAEKISNMTVFGFGIALVFIGLICIILLCFIMSAILKRTVLDTPGATLAVAPVQAPVGNVVDIQNRGELIAAVASVMAEELGADVSSIRILSVKKL